MTTCPHCGKQDEHPCYEKVDGGRVYECVRCGMEWTEQRKGK